MRICFVSVLYLFLVEYRIVSSIIKILVDFNMKKEEEKEL